MTQKIQVLSGEDFDQLTLPNRNVAELLRYRPGLFVNVLSRNDANWGSFGGLGPKYNEYLLDGLPVDSFADAMSLDPWALDRVEMHEGPASVLYPTYLTMDFAGNETPLAGITNLVLKDRVDVRMTRFLLGAGSWGTVAGRFYHQDRRGDVHYLLGASYEKSRYADYGVDGSWLDMVDDPQYGKAKLYAKLTWLLDEEDQSLSLFVHHTRHDGDTGRPNKDYGHVYDTVNVSWTDEIGERARLGVRAGYRGYDRRWAEDGANLVPPDLSLREHDGVEQQVFPAETALTLRHGGGGLLTVGADAQLARYETYSEARGLRAAGNDVDAWTASAFVQEKLVLGRWVLRAGGRFSTTHHSYDRIGGETPEVTRASWERTLWSAGARFAIRPGLAVYANAGSSFVAPSAKSIGGTLRSEDAGQPGRDGQLPNRDLKPESGVGLDAGLDLEPADSIVLGLRAFFNQVDDAIVENVVHLSPSQTRSVNAGRARSWGVEVSVEHTVSSRLEWFANATLAASDVSNPLDPDQDGVEISFVPRSVVNAGLTVRLPLGITASPYLQAVGTYYDSVSRSGRRSFGSYETLNVKLGAGLSSREKSVLSAFLDLNNVTSRRFEMPWQFRDPGFNALASLQLTF